MASRGRKEKMILVGVVKKSKTRQEEMNKTMMIIIMRRVTVWKEWNFYFKKERGTEKL